MQSHPTGNKLELEEQARQVNDLIEVTRSLLERSGSDTRERCIQTLTRASSLSLAVRQQIALEAGELKDLQALADIGKIVNSSLDLSEVLRIVMDTIIRLTKAERGFLMLREKSGELAMRIARNWERESIQSRDFEISSTVVKRVVESGQPVVTTDATEDPRFEAQASIIAYNLRSILCVPLKVKDAVTGVIYADNRIKAGLFSNSQRDLLAAFANQAAIAIENARLFQSVRQTLAEVTKLKNLMDNVFASIASGVITTDIKDRITLCNRSAEVILARTCGGMLHHHLEQALPDLAPDLRQSITEVKGSDQTISGMELNPTIANRGAVHLHLNLSPLKDAKLTTQGVAIVLEDVTERKRLEAQRRLFGRMVAPAVIEKLNPDKIQLGGERCEITTMFADIRGFTAYSETSSPEALVSVLNQYLAAAADAVLAQEGTIDKFMGDAVMAWFNAPIPQPDHTLRAVRAALGIRSSIAALHQILPPEAHLHFGVGIHFGEAVLGLVGTEKRLDYTAIGDSVNTAKRIQENAAANQILISQVAYLQVRNAVVVRPAYLLKAKGKSEPLKVYEVIALKEKTSSAI